MTEPSGTQALVAIICSAFVVGFVAGVAVHARRWWK